jgi:hypothetical protein
VYFVHETHVTPRLIKNYKAVCLLLSDPIFGVKTSVSKILSQRGCVHRGVTIFFFLYFFALRCRYNIVSK